jgi:hypothetical protein
MRELEQGEALISIIVCSIRPDVVQEMLNSVKNTIGTEYEVIVFDNRERNWGICKVYNYCAKQARSKYLCFMHEDVLMEGHGWGAAMAKFADHTQDCGCIGFAGAYMHIRNMRSWNSGNAGIYNYHSRIFDNKKMVDIYPRITHNGIIFSKNMRKSHDETFSQCLALDGIFLFVSKKIWEQYQFDEQRFTHFHFYDADFSFAIAQHYKNYVYFGANIYHLSAGNWEWNFCVAMLDFQKKWMHKLPLSLKKVGIMRRWRKELSNAYFGYKLCRKNGFTSRKLLCHIKEINGWLFLIVLLAGYIPMNFLLPKPYNND